jgi:RimJ/RimL family protein N-acetyltransferase
MAVTDVYEGLHAEVHLLVRPWAMRQVLETPVIVELLTAFFIALKVVKLKGKCLAQQGGAKRLLKSYGFRNQGYLKSETIFKGELADMELYELTSAYWFNQWIPTHDIWQREEG